MVLMRDDPQVSRLFIFARHAESAANAANVLSSDPSRPVTLTAHGRAQARALGAQLANSRVDLAVGTRLVRTQETIDIALHGRNVPVLIESGFDELRVGDLEGERIEAYRSWMDHHGRSDRLPHGESIEDALLRYADALRRLEARREAVTLVVLHELGLRYIAAAAETGSSPSAGPAFPNAVPYLFDEPAVRRAATRLGTLASPARKPRLPRVSHRALEGVAGHLAVRGFRERGELPPRAAGPVEREYLAVTGVPFRPVRIYPGKPPGKLGRLVPRTQTRVFPPSHRHHCPTPDRRAGRVRG
jgi:broad specificity phosphatase PhoE